MKFVIKIIIIFCSIASTPIFTEMSADFSIIHANQTLYQFVFISSIKIYGFQKLHFLHHVTLRLVKKLRKYKLHLNRSLYFQIVCFLFFVRKRFDYGEKFWVFKYKLFTCHCGTTSCRFSDKTIAKTLDEYNQRKENNF